MNIEEAIKLQELGKKVDHPPSRIFKFINAGPFFDPSCPFPSAKKEGKKKLTSICYELSPVTRSFKNIKIHGFGNKSVLLFDNLIACNDI